MSDRSFSLKVVVGGDGGVGKSCLLHRYCTNEFKEDSKLTVGVAILSKKIGLDYHGETCTFNYTFWDLGGQDRFRFMHRKYAEGAHAYLIAFDMTRYDTLNSLDQWVETFNLKDAPRKPTLIIGTKKDVWDPDTGGIPHHEIENKMDGLKANYKYTDANLAYFGTSSKTGEGVQETFRAIGYMVLAQTPASSPGLPAPVMQ